VIVRPVVGLKEQAVRGSVNTIRQVPCAVLSHCNGSAVIRAHLYTCNIRLVAVLRRIIVGPRVQCFDS
jgi:hypothetical protein